MNIFRERQKYSGHQLQCEKMIHGSNKIKNNYLLRKNHTWPNGSSFLYTTKAENYSSLIFLVKYDDVLLN